VAEQLFLVVVVVSALVYARGLSRLWHVAGRRRIVSAPQAAAFAGAFIVLLVALEPPLDSVVATNLPAHMVQHVLLLAVVPPLLAASAPFTVGMYALPTRIRRRVQPAWRGVLRSQEHRYWLAWTAFAFALANLTLATWHLPALYDAAVRNEAVHVFEHVSFVATATLFWWMVLGAGRRERRGLGVLGVFVATLPATALGVLMTLAATSWYAPYGSDATAVRNQQVAGAVMWGFGGLALVVGAAALFAGWLAAMDRADARVRARTRPIVESS
jgi:cytochrome c oxidase assembly factor CtaG